MLDGVVLARKTGAGALRRPVLVALGLRPDGRKEIVDFRLASRQRERRRVGTLPHRPVPPRAHMRRSRVDLRRRWPRPHRCPANRLSRHRGPALLGAQDQKRPQQGPQARPGRRQGRPPRHHERPQPAQGAQRRAPLRRRLGADLSQGRRLLAKRPRRPAHLLALQNPGRAQTGQNQNAIERRFREIRRRTRPMGTFQDRTSMDRILFAVFTHQNVRE